MLVHIPTHLEAYTKGQNEVEVSGDTLSAAFADLDRQFKGVRFRFITEQDEVREHFQVFVNKKRVHDLNMPMADAREIHIIAALSGG